MNTYSHKHRLVEAMLDAEIAGPSGFEARHSGASNSLLRNMYLPASGAALLCAVVMFLILYGRDQSLISKLRVPVVVASPVHVQPKAEAGTRAAGSSAGVPAAATPKASGTVSEPISFKLKRSRSFQPVGSVNLKLVRVNLKRRQCDLIIDSGAKNAVQRRLQLDRPLQIAGGKSRSAPVKILITAITRNGVSGSVSADSDHGSAGPM